MLPLANLSANAGAGTPGGWGYQQFQGAYPYGYSNWQQYASGAPGTPGAGLPQQAFLGSQQGSQDYMNSVYPQVLGDIGSMFNAGGAGINAAMPFLSQSMDPLYTSVVNNMASNPYFTQQLGAANQMAGVGQNILNTGFDPQQAIYQRLQQQTGDQANAIAAESGLAGSPYAASMTSNALANLNLNWQNQQAARQQQAAAAANPLLQQPGNVYAAQQNALMQALAERTKAGLQGAAGYGSLLGSGTSAVSGANQLGMGAAQDYATMAGLPFQTGQTIGANSLAGIQNLGNVLNTGVGLGNNQFLLPQQVLSDLMQYMGLGQSGSSIAGALQNQGFNQNAMGIGGLLSGGNMLFGNNGMFGSGGLFGSGGSGAGGGLLSAGGLLGSQGPLFGTAADASIAAGGPPLALAAAPMAMS